MSNCIFYLERHLNYADHCEISIVTRGVWVLTSHLIRLILWHWQAWNTRQKKKTMWKTTTTKNWCTFGSVSHSLLCFIIYRQVWEVSCFNFILWAAFLFTQYILSHHLQMFVQEKYIWVCTWSTIILFQLFSQRLILNWV